MDQPWVEKLLLVRDTMRNLNCGYGEATGIVNHILDLYNAEV